MVEDDQSPCPQQQTTMVNNIGIQVAENAIQAGVAHARRKLECGIYSVPDELILHISFFFRH
ncbi:MAG: hypothetical protein H6925_03335 [Holosporaceae bacterium]|nr:MAG: hypothetical protein H6925_03335 [Holosporaceae bacterium]